MFLKVMRSKEGFLCFVVAALFTGAESTRAGVVWYLDDYEGWEAAAGDVSTIDFDTLPDGSPSLSGTLITPDFNYIDQGVTFSGPVTTPFIAGNIVGGFGLVVDSYPSLVEPNWIIGDLVDPTHALAMSYPSFGILSIFDEQGQLIDIQANGAFGTAYLGVISDIPIASFTLDRHQSFSAINDYYQGTIPEPAVLTLVVAGSICLLCRQRRCKIGKLAHGISRM